MDFHPGRPASQLFLRLLRAHRVWRFVAIAMFAGVITLMGAIRIDQALFHHDAEKLLSVMHTFQVGVTTPVQAQQMLRGWPQARQLSGDCSRQCWAGVILQDSFRRHNDFFIAHRRLMKIYLLLGGTLAEVHASMQFVNGAFRAHDFAVYIYVPPFKTRDNVSSDYALMADARIEREPDRPGRPQWTRDPLHPTYRVGAGRPVGCGGCLTIIVTFAPEANSSDLNRLMQFDLSCLNRWWHPCRTQADIMPPGWKQFLQDQAQP